MRRQWMNRWTLMLAAASLTASLMASAQSVKRDPNATPFAEADLYFELNDTDGDLGFHGLIDGEGWRDLEIDGADGRTILDVIVRRGLRNQGMTELFFESEEPSFDELAPEAFFRRFPEGQYKIDAKTIEGGKLESFDEISHVMPAPPGNVEVAGIAAAENCDAESLPSVPVDQPVTISWAPVMTSHPELGEQGTIEVSRYEFVLEVEEPELVLSIRLPPSITEFEIGPELLALAEEFKFEIIVREESGNQTAVESCFTVG